MSQDATQVIVSEHVETSLSLALHTGIRFLTSARRASSPISPHKITWFTGNNKCRDANGKALPDIAGWAIECPDLDECGLPEDYELVDAMELLCKQGIAAKVVVMHQDEAGKPRPVCYWALSQASFFVVCEGVPSKLEMHQDPQCRWGVAWSPMDAGRRSTVAFLAFIKELMDAGYNYSFYVHLSSYCTDRMLACLYAHVRVLDFADRLREQGGDESPVPYYAYALPTRVSKRTLTAGKELGKTSEIYYPVPMLPSRLSIEYLESVAISADQAALLEEDNRVAATAIWSVETATKLIAIDEQANEANVTNVPF